MLPLYTISSKSEKLFSLCKTAEEFSYSPAYQAKPGMKLPVYIGQENKIKLVLAQWGTKKPLVSMDRILSTRPYNILIRKQRCAIPANCFFSLKNDKPHLVRLLQYRMFLMGGIFHNVEGEYFFKLLQTDLADMLNGMQGQMPVLFAPEKLSSWLKGEEVGRVIHYADRAGSYWFDYFPVAEQILEHCKDKLELLKPLGISQRELKDHEKKLLALAFEKERPNRSNLKH